MSSSSSFKKTLRTLAVFSLAMSVLSAQAVTVSPAKVEVTGDPGQTITDSFTVINEQNIDQTFYTSVENFESQGETGTPNFTASKEGLPSWVKVDAKITLKKGERIKVPYSIAIPSNADAGGHFAAIFLSTVPPATGEGEVSVGAKTGVLILLKVNGNITEKGGLVSFLIKEEKKMFTSTPINFVYKFKNDGNDRVKPEGAIVIKNMLGSEVARLDANKSTGNVLPSSTRRFEVRYGEVDAPAISAPFIDQVKFQMNNFGLGMYTATLGLNFGNQGKAEQAITFYILPWQLLSVVLGIALVVILVLFALLKQYNRWIIKQARAAAK